MVRLIVFVIMVIQLALENTTQNPVLSPVFARHETFHPRFGWLKKGFDAVCDDSNVFLAEDVHIKLGVGKNMAKSIRYWCGAFKLVNDLQATDFGSQLLGENGFDPYMEDPASLWLLHWNLLKNLSGQPCMATAWYYTFFLFRQNEFTQESLLNGLKDYCDRHFNSRIAESSLKKDVTCLLRMYVKQGTGVSLNEDNLDCPFAELGLIVGDSRHLGFRIGQKPNLPPKIIVAVCLDYASGGGQQTISISRLLYDVGSPGMAFKLTESALCDAIEQVAKVEKSISFTDSSGLLQMSFTKDPVELCQTLLHSYYR